MVYLVPNEFMAPANQVVQEETSTDINEDEKLGGLIAQLVLAKHVDAKSAPYVNHTASRTT
jgi:hypothetical protein